MTKRKAWIALALSFAFGALLLVAAAPIAVWSATLLPNGEQQYTDANGNPLASGRVYFFVPNTTTPKNTWTDAGQTTLNTNPVNLDSAGRAVIFGNGQYRQVVYDSAGSLVWDRLTQDVYGLVNVTWGGTSGGTANAQTLTPSVPATALSTGARFAFIAGFTNTSATTLNVSGLGATNVFKITTSGPAALTGGELVAGNVAEVTYDGSRFQLANPSYTLDTISATSFSVSGTFQTPASSSTATVWSYLAVGGGGNGGAAAHDATLGVAGGGGGGAGACAQGIFTGVAPSTSITITIGAATSPTSIGAPVNITANGGTNGTAGAVTSPTSIGLGGLGGTGGTTSGATLNAQGGYGATGVGVPALSPTSLGVGLPFAVGGQGGASCLGGGGYGSNGSSAAANGGAPGSGGGGGGAKQGTGVQSAGTGASGIVVIRREAN
jgi:hypothetical protein